MSYLDGLPEDIYDIISKYLHPYYALNLCVAQNIVNKNVLNKIKNYVDKIADKCIFCKLVKDNLIDDFLCREKACEDCLKKCYECDQYTTDNYTIDWYENRKRDHDGGFIPGDYSICCKKYMCADCLDDHKYVMCDG